VTLANHEQSASQVATGLQSSVDWNHYPSKEPMWQIMRCQCLHGNRVRTLLRRTTFFCAERTSAYGCYSRADTTDLGRARRHAQELRRYRDRHRDARGVEKELGGFPSSPTSQEPHPTCRRHRPEATQMESAIIHDKRRGPTKQSCGQYLERFYNAFTSDHGEKINIRPAVGDLSLSCTKWTRPSPRCRSNSSTAVVRVKAVKWAGKPLEVHWHRGLVRDTAGTRAGHHRARFLIRQPSRRTVGPLEITIGVPALLLFGLADATRSRSGTFHLANSTARILVRHTIYRVDSGLTEQCADLVRGRRADCGRLALLRSTFAPTSGADTPPTHRSCKRWSTPLDLVSMRCPTNSPRSRTTSYGALPPPAYQIEGGGVNTDWWRFEHAAETGRRTLRERLRLVESLRGKISSWSLRSALLVSALRGVGANRARAGRDLSVGPRSLPPGA